ncbi:MULTISPECIES: glycosyltransferase family 39 protein [unclassified Pseudomonas]|uniref:glycosyltransferase family 39 protein n=1 Tax=unclassified Pseudomonas TaxID=196821 RepID=UPI002AC9548C|nr:MULTISPECIES: glycosyltransferase family 39 protein [unclassified Pseudomonas]MEB0044990.1 glycosyltransferase family 39 protein [Pseudomonas sp. Dout3]MEB0095998.1 glycosyltransferase family 39 protein [Pseudomonas sp. DC1.2]WPX57862.1 glycosyltransferase family 39 protein [Pseudomonas sp. DC1.2]
MTRSFLSRHSGAESTGWLLIILLAAMVRFHNINLPYFWTDEAFSALVSVLSPQAIWFHMGRDVHPPLYFLMLHVWIAVFGDSVFAIRAMSAVAGVATVAVGMWLMRLISTLKTALLAGLLIALLPISVRYSQEARMYTLETLWLLGATIALVYWVKTPRNRYLVAYGLLMTAALYTHYLAILCALSHFLYLVILRFKRDETLHYLTRPMLWVAYAAISILYLPWLISLVDEVFVHAQQLKMGGDIFWIPGLTLYTLPSSIWRFLTLRSNEELPATFYLLLPILVAAAAVWVAIKEDDRGKFGFLLMIYTFAPVLAVALISFKFPIFIERYMAFAAMGIPMILALAIARVAQRHLVLAFICVGVLVSLQCAGLATLYQQRDDLDDPRNEASHPLDDMVARINESAIAGDSIVVADGYWWLTVAYYSRAGIYPLLYGPPWDDTTNNRPNGYGASTLIYQDRDKVFFEDLGQLPTSVNRVWWITTTAQGNEKTRFPANWKCLFVEEAGDMELRLYAVGAFSTDPGLGCSTY